MRVQLESFQLRVEGDELVADCDDIMDEIKDIIDDMNEEIQAEFMRQIRQRFANRRETLINTLSLTIT